MTHKSKRTGLAAFSLLLLSGPAFAQGVPSNAQCDQVMMVGPQHFSAEVVAACGPYFAALANGAAAPGTFATMTSGARVTVGTSGSGG